MNVVVDDPARPGCRAALSSDSAQEVSHADQGNG